MRDKKTGRRHSSCKECDKARVKARHQANPERTRNNDLKRNYGITLQEHQQMFDDQKGVCAICKGEGDGKWKKLCVDHDHKTGKVRQLLCRNCNMVLGQVGDNINLLEEMIKYLNKHTPPLDTHPVTPYNTQNDPKHYGIFQFTLPTRR